MSKIGHYVVELQERPEYRQGWEAAERDAPRKTFLKGQAEVAWLMGYDASRASMFTP